MHGRMPVNINDVGINICTDMSVDACIDQCIDTGIDARMDILTARARMCVQTCA